MDDFKELYARIAALEDVIKQLADLGDGCYVKWYSSVTGSIPYCGEEWDRHSETDAHKDDCPIAIARRLLDETL